jgi:hypothetical protein
MVVSVNPPRAEVEEPEILPDGEDSDTPQGDGAATDSSDSDESATDEAESSE